MITNINLKLKKYYKIILKKTIGFVRLNLKIIKCTIFFKKIIFNSNNIK